VQSSDVQGGWVFDWRWLAPLGIGLGSPNWGENDVVSILFCFS